MNSMANNLASMTWALVLGALGIGVLGCQNTPSLDPFMARAVVPPPSTGSFAPSAGRTAPYYNPNPPATPSPGPSASSGMVGPVNTVLTASALGDAAASGVQQTSAEASVLVGSTAGVPVSRTGTLTPIEAPLRIVENETPLATAPAIRPVGSAQSFGPGEPARFQPVGPIVKLKSKSTDEKTADNSASTDVFPITNNPVSGSLNWKPSR